MRHSQYGRASCERAAWNAGKKVGTKRPLTQKQVWPFASFSIMSAEFVTAPCSIWPSTASFAAAT
jgi:hypothetical protein